jgi:hypothetical protein
MTLPKLTGREAKRKADRDRYHVDPERFKGVAHERYHGDPERFRRLSQASRDAQTPQQKKTYLAYSADYYKRNAPEMKAKKKLSYASMPGEQRDEVNTKRRLKRLEQAKQDRELKEHVLPVLVLTTYLNLLKEEQIEAQQIAYEEARLARQRVGITITRDDVVAATTQFEKDGGVVEKIPTTYEKPKFGLVGIKGS